MQQQHSTAMGVSDRQCLCTPVLHGDLDSEVASSCTTPRRPCMNVSAAAESSYIMLLAQDRHVTRTLKAIGHDAA
jgi:hypothetical protein